MQRPRQKQEQGRRNNGTITHTVQIQSLLMVVWLVADTAFAIRNLCAFAVGTGCCALIEQSVRTTYALILIEVAD